MSVCLHLICNYTGVGFDPPRLHWIFVFSSFIETGDKSGYVVLSASLMGNRVGLKVFFITGRILLDEVWT